MWQTIFMGRQNQLAEHFWGDGLKIFMGQTIFMGRLNQLAEHFWAREAKNIYGVERIQRETKPISRTLMAYWEMG